MSGRRAALLLAVALVLTSCSREQPDREDPTPRPPSGPAVVVGFINSEGSPLASIPELREGSDAARKYINAELDGLAGRPIDFEVCITDSTPDSSAGCANRMVERGVLAVLGGVDLGSAASLPILAAAGIPYLGTTPLLPPDFTTDGAFTLDPGGLGVAASAAFAVDELAARRIAILHDDNAQGRQLAEAFVRPVLLRGGVPPAGITLVAERSDAADVAPALASATQGGPDAVIVVFPPPACARIMQAAAALGVDADMLYIGRCAAPAVVAAGGAGADGAYFFSSILDPTVHPNDEDVALYVEKIEKYGDRGLDPESYDVVRGFAVTMTFHRRLQSLDPTALTTAAIADAFRTAVDVPSFMGHPFTCDGRQGAPGFVSLCNSRVRIYQLKDGRRRDASREWISAGAAIAAPG